MRVMKLPILLFLVLFPCASLAFGNQVGEWFVADDGSIMEMALVPLEIEKESGVFPQFAPIVFNQSGRPLVGMYRRSTIARDRWGSVESGKDMDDYITVNDQNLQAGYFWFKDVTGRPHLLVVPSSKRGQQFLLNALKNGEVRMGRSVHKTPSFSDAWAALLKNQPL